MNLKVAGLSVGVLVLFATAALWAAHTWSNRARAAICDAGGVAQSTAQESIQLRRPTGIFGPVTAHPKAGDPAPDIEFTEVLHNPGSAPWNAVNLTGKTTVIVFFPLLSENSDAIEKWNAVVSRFADKPVQFVFIAGEEEATMRPFLKGHSVSGWVFYDHDGKTGGAYGLEDEPPVVFVGTDGRIIGFSQSIIPQDEILNAVLEGRVQLGPVGSTIAEVKAFFQSGKMRLDAEARRMPGFEYHKPAFPPSDILHVSPSKTELGGGNYSGDDFWSREGYTLKRLIAEIYKTEAIHIALPAYLDTDKRYDFALVAMDHRDREAMRKLAQKGVDDYFHISPTRERHLVDVYVVTTAGGEPPAAKPAHDDGMGSFSSSGLEYSTEGGEEEMIREPKPVGLSAISGISMERGTMDEFCRMFEATLDRPVVDETELKGEFDFDLKGLDFANAKEWKKMPKNDFLERLRGQLHLAITPAQRNVEMLVFYPH